MKKMKKLKLVSKKFHNNKTAIEEDRNQDLSKKVHHVDGKTKMLGKQDRIMRNQSSNDGLPKWRRR